MDRRPPLDSQEPVEESQSSRLRPYIAIGLLVIAVGFFAILIVREVALAPAPVEIQFPTPQPIASSVTVHVGGAVAQPGVYSLTAGSRVISAIERAGGLNPGADADAANMAEEIEDGSSYIVPTQEPTMLGAGTITVYLSGHVAQPGLYVLPHGSRMTDALDAAGGLSDQADALLPNLAEILEDGARYDIAPRSDSEGDSVFVHVVGAIQRPGTYTLPSGARLINVIELAGGVSSGADEDAVDLAMKLEDGGRYYVPYSGENAIGDVTVHIAGAVAEPGLYTLANGARLIDAILAAGGALSTADIHALNLAEPIRDGGRYAIPALRATINVNIAAAVELESVPGLSSTVAQAIVNYRQASGAFTAIDQLLNVPGIGPSTLAAIRPFVSVN